MNIIIKHELNILDRILTTQPDQHTAQNMLSLENSDHNLVSSSYSIQLIYKLSYLGYKHSAVHSQGRLLVDFFILIRMFHFVTRSQQSKAGTYSIYVRRFGNDIRMRTKPFHWIQCKQKTIYYFFPTDHLFSKHCNTTVCQFPCTYQNGS